MSLLLTVDPASSTPLWKQIVERVSARVEDGTLARGDRLPPTRVLATQLGVNRSTVCRAYEELWAAGYLESRQGSYSTVRTRERPLAEAASRGPAFDWSRASARHARDVLAPLLERRAPEPAVGAALDLARLTADPGLCPAADLRRALRRALAAAPGTMLDYGEPAGFRPLRETLARRLRAHGVSAGPDDIVLTQGAHQALDLVLRLLVAPGDEVAIEVPTYGMMPPLLAMHGARRVGIRMAPDGLDLDALERRFAARRPALLYTVPNFQNPTGITTSQAHRERLLALCESHRVPIVEDGFEEDMKYFGRAVLPIKSMDARGQVIYVGTFSKVVFPGLRVGWLAAERECARRLALLNRVSTLAGTTVAQAAMDEFCKAGRYDAYMRRLHATYRRRMTALLKGLAVHMPRGEVRWTEPVGGCTLWLTMAGSLAGDEPGLLARCRDAGVLVAPGSMFFPVAAGGRGRRSSKTGDAADVHVRLSISRIKAHQADEACRRLARALVARPTSPAPPPWAAPPPSRRAV